MDFFFHSLNPFFAPEQRLFWPYLLSSAVIAFIYLLIVPKKPLSILWSKHYWLHPSNLLDIQLMLSNSLLKVLIFTPLFFSSLQVSISLQKILLHIWPQFSAIVISETKLMLLFTLSHFIFLDFLRFYQHYLMHRSDFLWRFHSVHHSALILTPFTLFRSHPVELILSSIRNVLGTGIVTGFFLFLFKVPLSGYDVLGVNFLGFFFNLLGANLRHSHIPLRYGPLEYLFISPRMHQIHHQKNRPACSSNLGVWLSVWDLLFGTFLKGDYKKGRFGLKGVRHEGLWQTWVSSFKS